MSSRSRRPYLIRAIYDWCVDNGHTPHVLVSADVAGVAVPREFVRDGSITLNISPMAVQGLNLETDPIWFSARFSGRPFEVQFPAGAVLAIFARENGEGVVFGEVEAVESGESEPTPDPEPPTRPSGRSHLRVVK